MKNFLPVRMMNSRGFTLVETLVAITLIMTAIVAPMALTVQSLESAYYARDQITASNLAQEALEAVRSVRDANILATATQVTPVNLFQGILPTCATSCYVDATSIPNPTLTDCSGSCPPLQTDGQLFAYNHPSWTTTNFTRSVQTTVVWSDAGGNAQEIHVTATVVWQTAAYKSEQIQLSENLYNWVTPGAGT